MTTSQERPPDPERLTIIDGIDRSLLQLAPVSVLVCIASRALNAVESRKAALMLLGLPGEIRGLVADLGGRSHDRRARGSRSS